MARKRRSDSAEEQVAVMQAAVRVIMPPDHVQLEERDLPFWDSVLKEFARSEWSDHQLELAAMLARKMSDLEELQRDLRREGFTTKNAKGSPMANPLVQSIRMLDSSILATRRTLSLHARAQGGEARDLTKRRDAAKDIEANNPLNDDLIARPNHLN
jgi:hypothetical protein